MKKKISVIIPTNNNKHILKTINSVKEIADEIIVVNSADKNDKIIDLDYINIIEAPVGKTNAAKARNIGFDKAKNEIILFIDSDVEVIEESKKKFRN